MRLPARLTLGVATAAYQIEGAVREDGRGPSIWDDFAHTPGRIRDGSTGDVANDHYHRMEADLDLMADLGVEAYRFSIAWPRIFPSGTGEVNRAGLDFYSRLVDGLRARGIAPVATLYHWDLPSTLERAGGWPNRATSYAFADYASAAGAELGDRVATWTTLNEPWGSAYLGYAAGAHAPGRTDTADAFRAVHHLNLGHGLAVAALRDVVAPDAEISVTLNLHTFRPDGPTGPAARDRLQAVANDAFLSPMLEGVLPDALIQASASHTDWGFVEHDDLAIINQPLDVLGVNYYYTNRVRMRTAADTGLPVPAAQWPGAEEIVFLPPTGRTTLMNWNIDPAGLTELLLGLHERFPGLPLAVTENGAALPDRIENGQIHDLDRIDYLRRHLAAVAVAMDRGADVRGYYLWTLLDNFEWSLGYTRPFGIVHVDLESQQRTLKDSATWYRDVIRTRDLDAGLG